MRRRSITTAALISAAAIAAGPTVGASARPAKVTKVTTTLKLFAQGAPNPSGIQFGLVTSSPPLGKGVQYSTYTVTPMGMGHGAVAGNFTNYYRRGTTHGKFAVTFVASSPADITYTGTVTLTGGTGAFTHVKGNGTIGCTTSDAGAHKSCTVNSKLTGI